MSDLPLRSALVEALVAAGGAHDDYERIVLKGMRDAMWSGFYAAYTLGRLGEFTTPSRLSALLEEVEARSEWPGAAADHVLKKLRS